jgi:alpha-glucosidase (family GH31 glycosyl hydrolase)
LPSSVYSTLSASLSGLPFLSTDIGGFDWLPASEEVWLRWAQFGAMLPGMQTLNMPWWYSEKAQQHYRYLSWLHTDLIPYWQSLGNMAVESGTPICRHLVWNYQNDIETWRIDDEFTVGENILVAPIIEHNFTKKVYLPEGRWYDFWNDSNVYNGKKWIKYNKGWPDNTIKFPLYIREGAIIPLDIKNEITGFGWKESANYITIAIWPKQNGESSFTLHDLENPVQFKVSKKDRNVVIKWGNSKKDYLLRIHTSDNGAPLKVVCGDNEKQLTIFTTLESFLNSKKDGAVYLEKKNKVIIRKNSNENSGLIKILF